MDVFRCSRFIAFFLLLLMAGGLASAQIYVTVGTPPPPLPVYAQPPCPSPGYVWMPGYWSYGPYGYYWVPGTWVMAPQPGYYWTPGYWGYQNDAYQWYPGYWGPQVGYYGGIDYGYGYPGNGYYGGYWQNREFYYNRAVNNVALDDARVYNRTVVNNVNITRVSYNGGNGGVMARPTPQQEQFMRERHIPATNNQLEHERMAQQDHNLLATVNRGRPPVAATPKPTAFRGDHVVAARNQPVNVPATQPHAVNAAKPNEDARPNMAPRPNETPRLNENPRPSEANVARPNNVPRPPEHSNNAAAPRPENPPAAHNNQPAEPRPTPHVNQPEPYRSNAEPRPAQPQPRVSQPEPRANQPEPRPAPEPYHSVPPSRSGAPEPPRQAPPEMHQPEGRPMQSAPAPHANPPHAAAPAHPAGEVHSPGGQRGEPHQVR